MYTEAGIVNFGVVFDSARVEIHIQFFFERKEKGGKRERTKNKKKKNPSFLERSLKRCVGVQVKLNSHFLPGSLRCRRKKLKLKRKEDEKLKKLEKNLKRNQFLSVSPRDDWIIPKSLFRLGSFLALRGSEMSLLSPIG